MVAPRRTKKIFYTVVRVSAADDTFMRSTQNRFSSRPSDLLPWADPCIARLVAKLQDEVRHERTQTPMLSRSTGATLAELEPPNPSTDNEWDWRDEPRWSTHDEP